MLNHERAASNLDAADYRAARSGAMSGATNENTEGDELALGERVTITGVVVATTRFTNGDVTYSVEYERKGRTVSDWFNRGDLLIEGEEDVDTEQNGGGI
jgi:hypothetical protein